MVEVPFRLRGQNREIFLAREPEVLVEGMADAGNVTVSVGGAATSPIRDWLPNVLLGLADEALYAAKAGGKNCAVVRELPIPGDAKSNA